MHRFLKSKKAITQRGMVVALAIILIMAMFGAVYMWHEGYFSGPAAPSGGDTSGGGAASGGGAQGDNIVTGYSGILYFEVTDAVTGASFTTSTTTVDAVAATNDRFDFISGPRDTKAQSANPQAMSSIWSENTELILMPDCTGNPTNGLDYYPAMYYVKLYEGAPIYELHNLNCFKVVSTSPYTYQIDLSYATNTGAAVHKYTASNVNYWNLGKLKLYPRQAAADFDMYLTYAGTTLASVTDASTWVDTAAEITANATLASAANEHITFQMVGANANLGWGRRFYVVAASGRVEEYGAVIAVTTAMTNIGPQKLYDDGWQAITMSTLYAEAGYFKVIEPAFPAKGMKPGWTVDIPIDASSATAATAYKFSIWLADCQNLANIPTSGTSTSVPTAYGFVTSYGVGAVVQNTALTVSSGAGATQQLEVYLTTAS